MPKCSASNPCMAKQPWSTWLLCLCQIVMRCDFFPWENTHRIANHPSDGTPCLFLKISSRSGRGFVFARKFSLFAHETWTTWIFLSNRRPKLLLAVRNLPHFIMITSHIHPLSLDGCFSFEETTGCQMRASGGGCFGGRMGWILGIAKPARMIMWPNLGPDVFPKDVDAVYLDIQQFHNFTFFCSGGIHRISLKIYCRNKMHQESLGCSSDYTWNFCNFF